jgi:hypothetical protein
METSVLHSVNLGGADDEGNDQGVGPGTTLAYIPFSLLKASRPDPQPSKITRILSMAGGPYFRHLLDIVSSQQAKQSRFLFLEFSNK